ncbi:hypothetical protein GCM10023149_36810 [Mucilaginibacter gynuensis]|uniref:DUF4397 domain-containing protein n=1 Tax=Mucilaginibacter gynuensis TaxID=1302236 RepID=A0ABP8GWX3_9SPHI
MKLKTFTFLTIAVAALTACNKKDLVFPEDNDIASLNVYNLSTTSLNVFLNGNRLNTVASITPIGASGYMSVTPGAQTYQFKKSGTPDVLFTKALDLEVTKDYTLFVAGTSDANSFLVSDAFATDTSKTARIRFVNASTDNAGNKVTLNTDTVVFNGIMFKTATEFVNIKPGKKLLTVSQAGSVAVSDSVTFVSGRVYTIFSKGTKTGTEDAAYGAGIVANN